ncbi:MAG: TlpA family protein disulfide reductase [Candidatus Sericytochromatia bacterium]|nr:TlpA family protein disulfide reductase [Candidatus Tanganyikabacteria bacterium]
MRRIVALALALGLAAVPAAQAKPLFGSRKAPQFTLEDCATGKPLKLADFRGKVVLVNFWATWCQPCREEIPTFLEVRGRHNDKGFEIIGVSVDEGGHAVVMPFVAEQRISYPVVLDDGRTRTRFGGVRGIPTSFLLDRAGGIARIFRGPVSAETLEQAVTELL